MPLEFKDFREAQRSGNIVATFFTGEDDFAEHYVVTRDRVYSERFRQYKMIYVLHRAWSEDGILRPTDKLEYIGSMHWNLNRREAQIGLVELEEGYRGRGLGRMLYRTAINDLVERQKVPISDVYRSEMAERVWVSLIEANPDAIEMHQRLMTEEEREELAADEDRPYMILPRSTYYEVHGYVDRRPVKVRGHRRRAA